MNEAFFNQYLERIHCCVINDDFSDILEYIQSLKDHHVTDPVLRPFLEAEIAFYNKNYHEALKYYIEARHIPHFQFFCYRASAHLALETHSSQKAVKFIKKALRIKSDDFPSLKLICHLYMMDNKHEKVNIIKNKMMQIKDRFEHNALAECYSVGVQELDEFIQIMAKSDTDSDTLFAQELEELYSSKQ